MKGLFLGVAALATACTFPACSKAPPPSVAPAKPAAPPPSGWVGAEGRREAPITATIAGAPRRDPSRSPLGTNLASVDYGSRDWVFLDVFKMSSPWVSRTWERWDESAKLDLDDQGWVRSLEDGRFAATIVPTLGGGEYTLLYEGRGELKLDGDGRVLRSEPGRLIYETRPYQQTIVNILSTNPLDPVRGIRIVPTRYAASAQTFHPRFVEALAPFSVLRFMDWGHTNGSKLARWADRPRTTDATQGTPRGVAYEYMFELANATGADPWICVPHLADDEFVGALGRLAKERLEPSRRLYLELSNEVWNDAPPFTQSAWARTRGLELDLDRDAHTARTRFYSMRAVQVFGVFGRAFGDPARLVRVMGTQIGNAYSADEALRYQKAFEHVDAIAVAPYFGGEIGETRNEATLVKESPAQILDRLERESLPAGLEYLRQSATIAKKYGKPLIAYEGGQHVVLDPAIHNNSALEQKLAVVDGDPRMSGLYTRLLDGWREAGGQLFVHFTFVQQPTKWGRWGGLERMDQPITEAPKHAALLAWAAKHPRWW